MFFVYAEVSLLYKPYWIESMRRFQRRCLLQSQVGNDWKSKSKKIISFFFRGKKLTKTDLNCELIDEILLYLLLVQL